MISPTRGDTRGGFTLLELLLVVVILGIVTAVLVPQIGAGLEGAKLSTAARTTLQAARYSRTMALLNQAEVNLIFEAAKGEIRIEAADRAGVDIRRPGSDDATETAREMQLDIDWDSDHLIAAATNISAAQQSAQSFADEINATYECDGVKFIFLGYNDSLDSDEAPSHEATGRFTIKFRSNGTCRPFKIRLVPHDYEEYPDSDSIELSFDITGGGKVVDDATR